MASAPTQPSAKNKTGLRSMLLSTFVLLVAIPVLALSVAPSLMELNQERGEVSADLMLMADTQEDLVEQWLASLRSHLAHLANNRVTRPLILGALASGPDTGNVSSANPSRRELNEYLASLDTPFDRIVLMDAGGVVRASSNPALMSHDFGRERWFTRAAAASRSESVQVMGPLHDPLDGQNSFYVTMPVFDLTGGAVGVLGGRVAVDALGDVLATVPTWSESAEYYVVNEGLQYVIAPRFADDDELIADRADLTPDNLREVSIDASGHQTFVVARHLEPLDMWLVVRENTAKAALRSKNFFGLQFSLVTLTILISLVVVSGVYQRLNRLVNTVTGGIERIASGDLSARIPSLHLAEPDRIAQSINRLAEWLSSALEQQEEVVRIRTRELETTARMGQTIASQTDLQALLQVTIELISDQLGYYHAQIFLLDDLRRYAVLRASMGQAGRQMLEAGHKLAVGSQSVVGQAAARGEPVLASDTQQVDYWYPNPQLPDTRAEVAVPLRISGQTVGVLDVQATVPDAFDEPTIAVFKSIADQLAVAMRNAQLLQEKDQLLASSFELNQRLTRDGWDEYIKQQRRATAQGFRYDLSQVTPLAGDAAAEGDLRLPIALRGAIIGELSARIGDGQAFSEEDARLVNQVLDRVALAIDNARQVEQTQISLSETNRLYEATQRIASANSVGELAGSLVEIGLLETIDRARLYLLSGELGQLNRRCVEVAGCQRRGEDGATVRSTGCYPLQEYPHLEAAETAPGGQLLIDGLGDAPPDDAAVAALREAGFVSAAVFTVTSALSGHETLGWLVLESARERNALTEEDVRFFANVVDQAAIALDGVRMFEQTQARARRLQATNDVSRAASSILSTEKLLPLVVERINEAFDYYHVRIFLADKGGEWAVMQASSGAAGEPLPRQGYRVAVGSRSVVGQAIARAESIVAVESDPLHQHDELLPESRAELAIPLQTGGRVIGALDLHSRHISAFNAEAQAILRSLADQIAVSLENAQLFREIQDRVGELTTVNLISQSISRAQTLEELYDVVGQQLTEQFEARQGFLAVLDDEGWLQTPIWIEDGQRTASPAPALPGSGLEARVIATGELAVVDAGPGIAGPGLGVYSPAATPRSVAIVPMVISGEVMGLLGIMDPEREQAFDAADVRQLTTLATYIAVKIRNAELLEETERRADDLGFLFEVTRTAVTGASLCEALSGVSHVLLREIDAAEASAFYLAREGMDDLQLAAAAGYASERFREGVRTEPCQAMLAAAASGQSQLLGDLESEVPFDDESLRTRSVIAVPLISGREVIGVFTVESPQPDVFTENDRDLLEGASSTLTAIIDNARLLEQITRTNEQLRELDVLKSQFLANMSHELRTPLNSIIGFSRVMLKGIDGPLTDLQEQDLGTIYNSGQHLLSLINNILDLSKIEAGKMEIQSEYIDLGELLVSAVATGRGLVKDHPIDILLEVEPDLPQVYGDPVRVRQVLLNLVSNAAKFTSDGGIRLRARRRPPNPATDAPARVQIDVIDTGIGIAQEDMRKLFQAFSQVDGSTTRQVGGTGLGLAITREFVEMMGGRIWVRSKVGGGSTFSFTLPLYPLGVDGDAPADDAAPAYVLVVEPDQGLAASLVELLQRPPACEVDVVGAGVAALEALTARRPDILIMDPDLPDMDGYGLLATLRSQDAYRDLPVVILSDRDVSGSELQQLGEGAVRVFNKANGGASRLLDDLPGVLETLGR